MTEHAWTYPVIGCSKDAAGIHEGEYWPAAASPKPAGGDYLAEYAHVTFPRSPL